MIENLTIGNAGALHREGLMAWERGDRERGVELMARSIAIDAECADFHENLGTAYLLTERFGEAAYCFERAVALDPAAVDAHNNLGLVLARLGRPEEAEVHLRHALDLAPEFAPAWSNLANVLGAQGKFEEAVASGERALEIDPGGIGTYVNLANALTALGRYDDAIACCRQALTFAPGSADAHGNLGNALAAQHRLDEAIACFVRAAELRPAYAEAYMNLGNALLAHGRPAEAVARYRQLLSLDPSHAEAHSNLIFALDFDPRATAAQAFAERRQWNARHAVPLAGERRPHANDPAPDRPLRVGYVSADFREHSAATIFGPVVLSHDRERVTVVCYSGVVREDQVTARFREAAALWRSTVRLADAAMAELIREDRIDILVDLSGYSSGHRLKVFAMRPAPVQVTAWGHALGTGLDAMGYFFADRVTVPSEARQYFSEEIVELPAFVTYEPPAPSPDVGPLPALASRTVTFGSFNRPQKLTDEVLALWGRILIALPESRLLLKFHSLDQEPAQRRIRDALVGAGIAAARIHFRGGAPRSEHVAAHAEVDLALDPFPHGSGVTALDGLWMGVPMVTLCGERIPSRLGASFLTTLGLAEFITATPEEYVTRAVEHATDLERLARVRATLRARMQGSPLVDHRAYCRAVEEAYRVMWARWCGER